MKKGTQRDWSDPLAGFGALISAMGGGGDKGNAFPQSDADDLATGARFIPGEVTMARRNGEKVTFVQECGPCCWYWQMPDGSKIYHFDPMTYEEIARANGKKCDGEPKEMAGPCPKCGNVHTNGGTVQPEQKK